MTSSFNSGYHKTDKRWSCRYKALICRYACHDALPSATHATSLTGIAYSSSEIKRFSGSSEPLLLSWRTVVDIVVVQCVTPWRCSAVVAAGGQNAIRTTVNKEWTHVETIQTDNCRSWVTVWASCCCGRITSVTSSCSLIRLIDDSRRRRLSVGVRPQPSPLEDISSSLYSQQASPASPCRHKLGD